jgi:hypothetical protein
MEEHKVIIVVVILGIAAIVMMGLVAKVALLESEVASGGRAPHDSLRRQSAPRKPDKASVSGQSGGLGGAAAPQETPYMPPPSRSPNSLGGPGTPNGLAQSGSQPKAPPAVSNDGPDVFAEAAKSIVRLTLVDHKEEKNGVAAAVGNGGILLTSAPLLSGAYEGRCMLPGVQQMTPLFNWCISHSPESRLALLRVDDQPAPLIPLPIASVLPSKGARLMSFYETGQIDVGRAEATVQALLSGGDVAKKLQIDVPDLGDALWFELLGTFPQAIAGSPVVNPAGQLAGVILLDSQGTAGAGGLAAGAGFGKGFAATTAPAGTSMRRVYAVSYEALAPLLAQSTAPAKELLFTLESAPLQKPRSAKPGLARWSVKLASGETIDEKTFAVPAGGAGTGTLNYPGGGKCATLALSERKTIDGPLTVYRSDGTELLRETFIQGRREGALAVTDAAGQCVLAADFQRDQRHGRCAYFRDGAPWLIQEHREGALGAQHMVKDGAVFRTVSEGEKLGIIDTVLATYGSWPELETRLKALEEAIERWAKETDRRHRAPRGSRPNTDQLNAAQREAVAAIEEFRKLVD